MKLFREVALRKWNNEFGESIVAKGKKGQELNDLVMVKKQYNDKFTMDKIDEESCNDKLKDITIKRHGVEQELSELTSSFENKEEIVDQAVGFIQNAASLWNIVSTGDRSRYQKMVIPTGIAVNDNLDFGTVEFGASFAKAHLLAEEYEEIKKTQNDAESLLLIPRGVSLA